MLHYDIGDELFRFHILCEQLAELGWRKKRDGVIEQKEDGLVAASADSPANSLQIEFAAAHHRLGSVVFISMTILPRAKPCARASGQ
jgi:hypothetical protein